MKHLPVVFASIALAGVVTGGVLLGLLYRQMGRIEQRLTSLTLAVAEGGGASRVLPLPAQGVQVDFPWTDDHQDALDILTGPHRMASVLLLLGDGPKTIDEIAKAIPGDDESDEHLVWTMRGELRLVRNVAGDLYLYELSDRGRRILAAWKQIPEEIIDAAIQQRWHDPAFTPVPIPQP